MPPGTTTSVIIVAIRDMGANQQPPFALKFPYLASPCSNYLQGFVIMSSSHYSKILVWPYSDRGVLGATMTRHRGRDKGRCRDMDIQGTAGKQQLAPRHSHSGGKREGCRSTSGPLTRCLTQEYGSYQVAFPVCKH